MGRKQFLDYLKNNGVISFCTADMLAIDCALRNIKRINGYAVIEATSNQVNPEGGYTGMTAADFRDRVRLLASLNGLDESRLILGGDHLGPLPWESLPAEQAMEKAKALIRESVRAGFRKLHIDTTMPLGDETYPLDEELITDRWIRLYRVAEEEAWLMKAQNWNYEKPFYVIGNEVPAAGGAPTGEKENLHVTSPEALESTIGLYREKLRQAGFPNAFDNIIAIVGDFGIDYSDRKVWEYPKGTAQKLMKVMEGYPDMVLEAHSTDFQDWSSLKAMKEDGIRIFKVGPELSYAHRESLFEFTQAERDFRPRSQWANFPEVLEEAMNRNPVYWKNWYHGTEEETRHMRMHSRLNRDRYYMNLPEVQDAVDRLLQNFNCEDVGEALWKDIDKVVQKYLEVLE